MPAPSADDMLIAASTHMPPSLQKEVRALVGLPVDQQRIRLRRIANYTGDTFLSNLADQL